MRHAKVTKIAECIHWWHQREPEDHGTRHLQHIKLTVRILSAAEQIDPPAVDVDPRGRYVKVADAVAP